MITVAFSLGLTCYQIAVLQCLLGQPSFLDDVLSMDIKEPDPGLVQTLQNVAKFKNLGQQDNVNDAIKSFRKQVDKALPQFKGNRMHDAHEFLVSLFDHMLIELGKTKSTSPIEDNFAFKLQETRTCFKCKHASQFTKEDHCLRLDMPEANEQVSH